MADPDGNTYGPFDVEVPDSYAEPFTEAAWYRLHDESGVISGGALTFDGLTAALAPIFAQSHGAYLYRDTVWTDTSPATTDSDPRRDLLVIRRILTVGEGEGATPGRAIPLVLRGTPAPAPVNPEHDPDTDELLWSWQVPGGGGVTVTSITDHRRMMNAYRQLGPAGLVGGKESSASTSVSSSTAVKLGGTALEFVAHLVPGRAYEYTASFRAWGATSTAVAGVACRLVADGVTATASSPLVAGNTAVLDVNGDYRTPLPMRRTFQVAVEDDYRFTVWINRTVGSGPVTVGLDSTGFGHHSVSDVGVAQSWVPFPV